MRCEYIMYSRNDYIKDHKGLWYTSKELTKGFVLNSLRAERNQEKEKAQARNKRKRARRDAAIRHLGHPPTQIVPAPPAPPVSPVPPVPPAAAQPDPPVLPVPTIPNPTVGSMHPKTMLLTLSDIVTDMRNSVSILREPFEGRPAKVHRIAADAFNRFLDQMDVAIFEFSKQHQ